MRISARIGIRVFPYQMGGERLAIKRLDLDLGCAVHDMTVGNDETIGGKDKPRATSALNRRRRPALLFDINFYYRPAHALGYRGDRPGVVVEQVVVICAGMNHRMLRKAGRRKQFYGLWHSEF